MTKKDRLREKIINSIPPKVNGRRKWTNETKMDVVTYCFKMKTTTKEKKRLAKDLEIHENMISRWKRGRGVDEPEPKLSKTVFMPTARRHKRVVGTKLKNMLEDIAKKDIVTKVSAIKALSSAGFKDEQLVPIVDSNISMEDWNAIKTAVTLLMKDYKLERKENA